MIEINHDNHPLWLLNQILHTLLRLLVQLNHATVVCDLCVYLCVYLCKKKREKKREKKRKEREKKKLSICKEIFERNHKYLDGTSRVKNKRTKEQKNNNKKNKTKDFFFFSFLSTLPNQPFLNNIPYYSVHIQNIILNILIS